MGIPPKVRVELGHGIDLRRWPELYAKGIVPDPLPFGLHVLADAADLDLRAGTGSLPLEWLARRVDHRLGGLQWTRGLVSVPPQADLVLCWDEWTGLPAALRRSLHRRRGRPGPPVLSGIMNLTDWWDLGGVTERGIRAGLRGLTGMFTHTTVQRDLLVQEWGVPAERISVVPFGVDPDYFRPRGNPVPGLVVSVGDDEHRDHALLSRAVEQVRLHRPEARLLLATTRAATVPERTGRVIAAKLGSRRPQFYGAGQVVAVAATETAHGSGLTVVLEAMASARPWVATASPGFADHFGDGDGGLLVPPGDVDAFAAAIESLLADPERASALGRVGRELVKRRLNSTVMGTALAQLAHRVLAEEGGDRPVPARTARVVAPPEMFAVLRCPVNGASLRFVPAASGSLPGAVFGVLVGGAYDYPVLDGVAVLRHGRLDVQGHVTGEQEVAGPRVDELIDLVRAGQGTEALARLLALPPALAVAGRRIPGQDRVPGLRSGLSAARRWSVRRHLEAGSRGTLEQWIERLHKHSDGVDTELANYFRQRDVLPRQLAALAVLPALARWRGPIVDLACGLGHFSRHLLLAGYAEVLGVDRTFHQVWLAAHFVAPGGTFVCADANKGLPIADGAAGSVFCSDALHFLDDPKALLREVRRCCPGPAVFTRVGNLDVEPHEGDERTPEGWSAVFGERPHRVLGERALLRSYLGRERVALQEPQPLDGGEKWLTLISGPEEALTDLPAQEEWPHAKGKLRFNPIYVHRPLDAGAAQLVFTFPSTWFAFENHLLLDYHAAAATVAASVIADVRAGRRSPEVQTLIDSFVVIGGGESEG